MGLKCSDLDKDGVYETKEVIVNNLALQAPQPLLGHTTRSILIDDAKQKIYVSIGSLCNACREDYRAVLHMGTKTGLILMHIQITVL